MDRASYQRIVGIVFLAATLVFVGAGSVRAYCVEPPGDITVDGTTDVYDVQCSILATIFELGGAIGLPPTCLKYSWQSADMDCDLLTTVVDVLMMVQIALDLGLAPELDGDGDLCADVCMLDDDDDGTVNPLDCAPQNAAIYPGAPELCNVLDDDCDDFVDEDFVLGAPCGNSPCDGGVIECGADVPGLRCSTMPGGSEDKSGVDVCDSVDNDCDGSVDEDFPLKGTPCDTEDSDFCTNGTYACTSNGTSVYCPSESVYNIEESCGEIDENCDGNVNEGVPLGCTLYYKDEDNDGAGSSDIDIFFAEDWSDGDASDWVLDVACFGGLSTAYSYTGGYGMYLGGTDSVERTLDLSGVNEDVEVSYYEKGWSFDGYTCDGQNARFDFFDGTTWHTNLLSQCNDAFDWSQRTVLIPAAWLGPENRIRWYFYDTNIGGCCCGDYWVIDAIEVRRDESKCLCAPEGLWNQTNGTDCNDLDSNVNPDQLDICNSVDDDCDGIVDNDFGAGDECTKGTGDCANTGINLCNEAGDGVVCSVDYDPDGTLCTDWDPCTHSDVCLGGDCVSVPYACGDEFACTDDVCLGDGTCDYPLQSGKCLILAVCIDDAETHPTNDCLLCEPGFQPDDWTSFIDGTPCEDGDACTQESGCVGGTCQGGAFVDCDDENICTVDSCDAGSGCQHQPVAAICDDGDICTSVDSCVDGVCEGVTPFDCDDDNSCSLDTCDSEAGCNHTALVGPCDDGNVCTSGDFCIGGGCIGTLSICDDGEACTVDSCDPVEGCVGTPISEDCCSAQLTAGCGSTACSDCVCGTFGICCTFKWYSLCANLALTDCADVCGCDGLNCDDGAPCTEADGCTEGTCVGSEKNCDDGDACTTDYCETSSGLCQNVILGCDDSDPCTTDTCSDSTGCANTPKDCDDGSVCTTDTCDGSGNCVHTNINTACDDLDACTGGDSCQGGACVGIDLNLCLDTDCASRSCVPESGTCVVDENFDGASCSDGDPCTIGDTCQTDTCVGDTGDGYESNDFWYIPSPLASFADCDGYPAHTLTDSRLYPAGDEDWFSTSYLDLGACGAFVSSGLTAPAGTLYRVCAYYKCSSLLGVSVVCENGIYDAVGGPSNSAGCCEWTDSAGKAKVSLAPTCVGAFDQSGTIYLNVGEATSSSISSCDTYELTWGVE